MVRVSLILFFLLIAMPTMAQTTNSPEAISAQNAADLHVVAQIGAALQGKLVWSPDSETLAVGTSDSVLLYRPDESDQPIAELASSENISFDQSGAVVTDSGRYDAATGTPLGEAIGFSPSGRYTYTSESDGVQTLVLLRDTQTGESISLATGIEPIFRYHSIIFSPDEQRVVIAFTGSNNRIGDGALIDSAFQLWDIPNAALVMADSLNFERFGSAKFDQTGSVLYVSSIYTAPVGDPPDDFRFYDGRTGELLEANDYDKNYSPTVVFSPDRRLIAYFRLNEGEIIVREGRHTTVLRATYLGTLGAGWATDRLKPDESAPVQQVEMVEKPFWLRDLRFSPDNRYLIAQTDYTYDNSGAGAPNALLIVWEVSSIHDDADPSFELPMPHDQHVTSFVISPNGENLFALARSAELTTGALFNLDDGSLIAEASSICPTERFLSDSRYILTACISNEDGATYTVIYDPFDDRTMLEFAGSGSFSAHDSHIAYWNEGHVNIVETSAFSKVGDLTSIPGYLGQVQDFDPAQGIVVFDDALPHCLITIADCEIPSPDVLTSAAGRYQIEFTTSETDETPPQSVTTFAIRDTRSDEILAPIRTTDRVGLKALSPDGTHLALFRYHLYSVDGYRECDAYLYAYDLSRANEGEIENPAIINLPYGCGFVEFLSLQFSPDNQIIMIDLLNRNCGDGACILDFWTMMLRLESLPSIETEIDLDPSFYSQTCATTGSVFAIDSAYVALLDAPVAKNILQSTGFNLWSVESILAGDLRGCPYPPNNPLASLPDAKQITISPDGLVLAARGADQVGLWDVAGLLEGESEPLILIDIEGAQEIGFTPDGRLLLISTTNRAFAYGVS